MAASPPGALDAALHDLRPGGDDDEADVRAEILAGLGVTPRPVRLGRYVLGRALGKGGAGAVFEAHDERLGRQVAVKLVRARITAAEDASMAQRRLLREARAAARLSHPNVVEVYDVGNYTAEQVEGLGIEVASEGVYLVMELVQGVDLSRWLETPRSFDAILRVMRAAGRGLAASHVADLVHRDFKPSNVMVCDDGSVKVADFGLARINDSRRSSTSSSSDEESALSLLTEAGLIVGTPPYMSPEQQAGHADDTADQYAYCVTLFQALVGHRPFRGGPVEMYAAKISGKVPDSPGVPPWLRAVIVRGLQPVPADRYPSMRALLAAMTPPTERPRMWPWALGVAAAGALWLFPAGDDCSKHLQPARELHAAGVELADTAQAVEAAWQQYCSAAASAPDDPTLAPRRECLAAASERRLRLVALWQAKRLSLDELDDALDDEAPLSDCFEPDVPSAPVVPQDVAADVRDIRARLTGANALHGLARFDLAYVEARAALVDAEATGYVPVIAEARQLVGHVEVERGRFDEAADLLERAYWEASEVDHLPTQLSAAEILAHLLGRERNEFEAARRWEGHAEAALERMTSSPAQRASLVNVKAINRLEEGDREGAAELMEEAIALLERAEGDRSSKLAQLYANLGEVRSKLGAFEAADRALARAAELREQHAPGSPAHAAVLATQAQNLARQGELARAVPLFDAALEVLGDHPFRKSVLSMKGAAQGKAGFLEEAEAAFEAAAAEYEREGLRGDDWATAHENIAKTLTMRDRWAEARSHLELAAQGFSVANPMHAYALGRLAGVELELGNPSRCQAYLVQAVAAAESAGKVKNFDENIARIRERLAEIEG